MRPDLYGRVEKSGMKFEISEIIGGGQRAESWADYSVGEYGRTRVTLAAV
jgi:hypothetical protein